MLTAGAVLVAGALTIVVVALAMKAARRWIGRWAAIGLGLVVIGYFGHGLVSGIAHCGADPTFVPQTGAGGGEDAVLFNCDGPGGVIDRLYLYLVAPVILGSVALLVWQQGTQGRGTQGAPEASASAGPAQGRFGQSLVYWRVFPIGIATAFVSGGALSVLASVLVVKMEGAGLAEIATNAVIAALVAALVGLLVWLPMSVVWHLLALRLSERLPLSRAAMIASGAICLAIVAGIPMLASDWAGWSMRGFVLWLAWAGATLGAALAFTYLGFHRLGRAA